MILQEISNLALTLTEYLVGVLGEEALGVLVGGGVNYGFGDGLEFDHFLLGARSLGI